MVRKDVYDAWGFPTKKTRTAPRLRLEDVLLPESEVEDLWLDEERYPITWDEGALARQTDGSQPIEVGTILGGGWGNRVYRDMVPATKASAWGPAGRTHLISQRRDGKWAARTLHLREVARFFS